MLYIRTDMNAQIATGHMMRCLSIADAVRDLGGEVTFLVADDRPAGLLEERGHRYRILGTRWDRPEEELPVLLDALREERAERLLVDSYQVTEAYLRALRETVWLAYLDDLDRFLYPVDALICYAAYWDRARYPERYPGTQLCLGPRYAPLRREFLDRRAEIHPEIRRILLLTGGGDPCGAASRLLDALDSGKYEKIVVVCGRYGDDEALRRAAERHAGIEIRRSVRDMADLMLASDLTVSAAGSTLYELCACGAPAISYTISDDQIENAARLQELDLIDCLGDLRRPDGAAGLEEAVGRCTFQRRRERSEAMRALVDGRGAGRIAAALLGDGTDAADRATGPIGP